MTLKNNFLVSFVFFCMSLSQLQASSDFKIQAVIFDCDGVLVDTEFLKYQAWKEVLKKQNIDFQLEEYNSLVGMSSEKILEEISKKRKLSNASSIILEKNKKYQILQKKGVKPLDPAIEFVKFLYHQKKQLGIKLALASSASREEILENLKQINLTHSFDVIISGSDDLKDIEDPEGTNKPKPYIYLKAAKQLNTSPANCIVFEDSNSGVEAAVAAGMTVYATPNPFTLQQDFSKSTQVFNPLPKPHKLFELLFK